MNRHIRAKLNLNCQSDNKINFFLGVCKANGIKSTDLIKLGLNRLIEDVSQGLIQDIAFPPELIESTQETKNDLVEESPNTEVESKVDSNLGLYWDI